MDDDNLSTAFSVDSSASQLSIATTANQTVASNSVAATVTGEVEMQPLPANVPHRTGHRRSALEPFLGVTVSDGDGNPVKPGVEPDRSRTTSNTTFSTGTTIIDEQHANYVLMYDMLTGIRISVPPPMACN